MTLRTSLEASGLLNQYASSCDLLVQVLYLSILLWKCYSFIFFIYCSYNAINHIKSLDYGLSFCSYLFFFYEELLSPNAIQFTTFIEPISMQCKHTNYIK